MTWTCAINVVKESSRGASLIPRIWSDGVLPSVTPKWNQGHAKVIVAPLNTNPGPVHRMLALVYKERKTRRLLSDARTHQASS